MNSFVVSMFLSVLVMEVSNYRSALQDIVFTNVPHSPDEVHSEYYFGRCAQFHREKDPVHHDHYTFNELSNNAVMRGFFNNNLTSWESLPNCVYIRASSPYGDMVKYDAYKFNVCFVEAVFYYVNEEVHENIYYEWFIPVEMRPNINWDLYFYNFT